MSCAASPGSPSRRPGSGTSRSSSRRPRGRRRRARRRSLRAGRGECGSRGSLRRKSSGRLQIGATRVYPRNVTAATPGVDGRTARAERTRAALAEALLSLLEEGDLRPTAASIAARAGVSERTLFQHFPEREALFHAAALAQAERIAPLLRELP